MVMSMFSLFTLRPTFRSDTGLGEYCYPSWQFLHCIYLYFDIFLYHIWYFDKSGILMYFCHPWISQHKWTFRRCVCLQTGTSQASIAIVVNAKVSAGAQTHTWSPGHSRYWSWLGSILAVVLVDIPACHRAAGAEADSTQSTDGLTSVTAQNDRWHHQVPHTLGTPPTNNCMQPFFHGRDPHEKVLQLRKWLHNLNNPVQSEMTPSKENERRRRCSLWFLIWRKVNSSV